MGFLKPWHKVRRVTTTNSQLMEDEPKKIVPTQKTEAEELAGRDSAEFQSPLMNNGVRGFKYIQSLSTHPAGLPTPYHGYVPMVWDESTHRLWIFSGGNWRYIDSQL